MYTYIYIYMCVCLHMYTYICTYTYIHRDAQDAHRCAHKYVSNPGYPSSPPIRPAPCAGRSRKTSCGPTRHRGSKYCPGRTTSPADAPQPDRRRTRQQGGIDGIHTHATFEPINSPIRPPCSTHALATAHEHKWQGLKCKVPPDFCPITTFVPRLGIRRAVQQLGAPSIFKTLAARTRLHGGLRRARLAHDTGRRARAKTAPRGAGSTRRHWSLCMRVEWAVTSRS